MSTRVPLIDLRKQYHNIKPEIDKAIKRVINSGVFIGGEEVESFEKEFAHFCRTKHGLAVANGTEALYLSLRALGIGKQDEVITTPYTFIATVEAITLNQAKPVFVDIDPETYNIDCTKIEEKITKRTKAIIPVHIYGQPADMDKINTIAKKYKLWVIEDACQAHGAEYKNKKVGSLGDIACFSFYPSKNLGAFGDGGMVVTDNQILAKKIKILRDHGQAQRYKHVLEGMNSRLDTIQSAILRVKLLYLEKWNNKRIENANYYTNLLKEIGEIITPKISKKTKSVFHIYAIQFAGREALNEFLQKENIYCGIHYPIPLHLQKAYKFLGYKRNDFPIAERISRRILSLPMYPELNFKQIEQIVNKIKEFMNKKR